MNSDALIARARITEGLQALPRHELKRLWADLGYIILPAAPEWHDRPETALQTERLIAAIAASLAEDFASVPALAKVSGTTIECIVRDFYELAPNSPVNAKKGGNGFNGCLQVYAVARVMQPKVIIESGVFRGQTTWVLRQACPKASIFCFDPVLDALVYKDRDAIYSASDWSEFDLSALPVEEALAFFDDHMDQGRRILEAQARGIKTLLFDDNAPASRIHTVGGPPIPSLDRLMDESLDGEDLAWTYRGRRYECQIEKARAIEVRNAVATLRNFADMHRVTGYTPARITCVSLR